MPERIAVNADPFPDVQIECRPAPNYITRYRRSEVCIYADPLYPLKTLSNRMYANEMIEEDHDELLDALILHPGPFLLNSYQNKLYETKLKNWSSRTKIAYVEQSKQRIEVLLLNPITVEKLNEASLFSNLSISDRDIFLMYWY